MYNSCGSRTERVDLMFAEGVNGYREREVEGGVKVGEEL